jgi:hypothetical protein
MRKRPRADYDEDHPFTPSLTVYEPSKGFGRAIGFVRFWIPVPPTKPKTRKRKPPAKRK